MGGEWYFVYKKQDAQENNTKATERQPLDLQKYQDELVELRKNYESEMDQKYVTWCETVPPEDNIFVRFKFSCERHSHWGEENHPWFNFYWIPVDVEQGSLHNRCSIDYPISNQLFEMQRRVAEKFPEYFQLYREFTDLRQYDSDRGGFTDMYSGYDYESDRDQESPQDFTACDKDDCGYCGHCFY